MEGERGPATLHPGSRSPCAASVGLTRCDAMAHLTYITRYSTQGLAGWMDGSRVRGEVPRSMRRAIVRRYLDGTCGSTSIHPSMRALCRRRDGETPVVGMA